MVGPRPLSLLAKLPTRALEGFAKALTLLNEQSRPLREGNFSLCCGFPHRHSRAGPTKAQARGRGRVGELLCYMERLSPFVREQGPAIRQTNTELVPKEAKLLSLASLTLL